MKTGYTVLFTALITFGATIFIQNQVNPKVDLPEEYQEISQNTPIVGYFKGRELIIEFDNNLPVMEIYTPYNILYIRDLKVTAENWDYELEFKDKKSLYEWLSKETSDDSNEIYREVNFLQTPKP